MSDLFDYDPPKPPADAPEAHARRDDPETSHEAAKVISPKVKELQKRVLAYAAGDGRDGFTDRDLEAYMGDSGSTYRTRRAELTKLGLIESTGEKRYYPPKNHGHLVWRVTDEGIKAAKEQAA